MLEGLASPATTMNNTVVVHLSECTAYRRLQSAFPKVHFSEDSLFRRFIVPKVHCFEGSLFRRLIAPKKRFIVPKVYWSEGSFIRNRGSLLRRFIVPKVHCSEISHLSDRKMLICYDKNEMIRAFGRATFVHLQAKLGQEMVHEMNQMTLLSRHRIRTLAVLRSRTLPRSRRFPLIFSFTNGWRRNILLWQYKYYAIFNMISSINTHIELRCLPVNNDPSHLRIITKKCKCIADLGLIIIIIKIKYIINC